jgi:hypothetical protein
MVWVKFFYPDFSWTWYGIEFDGKDFFYGYVEGNFPERVFKNCGLQRAGTA